MPAFFTRALAQRLDRISALTVEECGQATPLRPGLVLLATGGRHLLLRRDGGQLYACPDDGPEENFCRPSADVLFRSAVALCGARVLGIVMTGMGQDGECGARAIRDAGGQILAQDRASSVVWGMPAAVVEAGLANRIVSLADLPAAILERVSVGRPWYQGAVQDVELSD